MRRIHLLELKTPDTNIEYNYCCIDDDFKDKNGLLIESKAKFCNNYCILFHQKCEDTTNYYMDEKLCCFDQYKTKQIMKDDEGNTLSIKNVIYNFVVLFR